MIAFLTLQRPAPVRPMLNVLVVSAIWVLVALFVAFPDFLLTFAFGHVAEEFLLQGHALFLGFLVIVDMALDLWLLEEGLKRHCLTRPRIMAFMLICLAIYLVVGVFLPPRNRGLVEGEAVILASACILLITFVRAMWFYSPRVAREL